MDTTIRIWDPMKGGKETCLLTGHTSHIKWCDGLRRRQQLHVGGELLYGQDGLHLGPDQGRHGNQGSQGPFRCGQWRDSQSGHQWADLAG